MRLRREGFGHEASRVHHAARRCDCDMAARRARGAGDRVRSIAGVDDQYRGRSRRLDARGGLRQGLRELGWIEGQNLRIDWRWSGGDVERIRDYAAESRRSRPDLIVANGAALLSAVKQATQSIPIVFVLVSDPVGQGFISGLKNPGGNITGFAFVEYSMFGKSLELLKQVAPGVTQVGFIFNPDTVPFTTFLPAFETHARYKSVELTPARVRTEADIAAAVARLAASAWRQPDRAAGCVYHGSLAT